MTGTMARYTAHQDAFARDRLPEPALQPQFLFPLPALQYGERLNCADRLLDHWIAAGHCRRTALITARETWSYGRLCDAANRIAAVLTGDLGLVPGARVLLRAPNSPLLAAAWLGVMKAGMIAVTTAPLLRSRDLEPVLRKAMPAAALCDMALLEDLEAAQQATGSPARVLDFDATGKREGELEQRMARQAGSFTTVETAAEDVALIAFTSGTTGDPKGTMHFHRDMLSVCVCVCDHLLRPGPDDVFVGTAPFAFTFGLGMELLFPLYAGASVVLPDAPGPLAMGEAIGRHRATICASAPTGYRALLREGHAFDLSTLRLSVSAGEHLPPTVFGEWRAATGLSMVDGLGATEMLHIFASAAGDEIRPGRTGRALPGYQAAVLGEDNRPLPAGEQGRLAVRGPTGCRYLADPRQRDYVQDGWNLTGDVCTLDEQGYVIYHGRADDMIVSAGYNISAGEVESVLLAHPAVAECAVVGAPDAERGTVVKAFVVTAPGFSAGAPLAQELQEFVKGTIAPYKYPRAVEFLEALPRNPTGKLQRYRLRRRGGTT